jgi:hypothetical protein
MKRTLTHLGVLAPPPTPPTTTTTTTTVTGTVEATPPPGAGPVPAPAPAPKGEVEVLGANAKTASTKLKAGKTLAVSRKGTVGVRINCTGDAGAVCRGTVKLVRGSATVGSKSFAIKAGKTTTVSVTLKRSARKASKATLVVKASGLNARQTVKLR